jgi:hypothetical protein
MLQQGEPEAAPPPRAPDAERVAPPDPLAAARPDAAEADARDLLARERQEPERGVMTLACGGVQPFVERRRRELPVIDERLLGRRMRQRLLAGDKGTGADAGRPAGLRWLCGE